MLWVEDDLGKAIAVPQIDKDDAAVIAATPDPSHQHYPLVDVRSPEGPAVVRAFPVA